MENHPGLWEEAENPENDHAVDELDDLWFARRVRSYTTTWM